MTTTEVPLHRSGDGLNRSGRGLPRRLVPTTVTQGLVWVVALVLVAGPIVPLIYTSFRSQPYYLPGGTWSLQPYRTLFDDPAFWHAVENTLVFAGVTTVLAVGFGTLFAVLVNRTNLPGRRWLRILLVAPIVIPPLGLIVGWTSIYGSAGYITQIVGKNLGLPVWNLSSIAGMSVLGCAVSLPIAFLTCQASLKGADATLENAALSAGASPAAVLRRITVPLLRPAILNSAILIFALSLETLGIPLFIGTPANINFYASYLYNGWVNGSTPNPPFVSAGAVLLLVVVTLLLIARTTLLGSEERFIVARGSGAPDAPPLDLGRARHLWAVVVGAFVVVTSIVPLVGLGLMSSVKELTTLVAPWHLWTSANWQAVYSNATFRRSILDSLLIAAVGGIVTVVFVALATLIAHRSRFPMARTMPPLLVYPRAIPGIILGVGFFWAFLIVNVPGEYLRNSIWGEMLALCVRNITIAYIVLYPSVATISNGFDQAASAAGARWWTIARRITLPILRPAMIAAFVLMFITLLSDYDPVVFLQKPGTEVLGVTMLQSWEKGLPGLVAALAVLQVAVVGAVLLAAAKVLRRRFHA